MYTHDTVRGPRAPRATAGSRRRLRACGPKSVQLRAVAERHAARLGRLGDDRRPLRARRPASRPAGQRAVNRRAAASTRPARRRRRARILVWHHAQHPARSGRKRAVNMGARDAESTAAAAVAGARGSRGHARGGRSGGGAQRGAAWEATDEKRRHGVCDRATVR